ncbi:hypothetical protein HaLaN_01502 [Haematococcus lacustris]|uniref:Uncharacterized protein n=1 Tax=Haematococcus lacustris TaxID=44745 RepID=A0A699YIW0_HAELA|nr:hypothetical protein HaLaN_01502 [Haematococcus lacustris]
MEREREKREYVPATLQNYLLQAAWCVAHQTLVLTGAMVQQAYYEGNSELCCEQPGILCSPNSTQANTDSTIAATIEKAQYTDPTVHAISACSLLACYTARRDPGSQSCQGTSSTATSNSQLDTEAAGHGNP